MENKFKSDPYNFSNCEITDGSTSKLLYAKFPNLETCFLLFLFLNFTLKKKFIGIRDLNLEEYDEIKNKDPILIIMSFVFIVFIIFEFMSLNLSNYRLDLLHDGDFLTPAQNYLSTNNFWQSTFMMHGGSDIFYPIIMWKILWICGFCI